MRAGLLTERIDILRPTVSTSTVGEQVVQLTVWCSTRARLVVHRQNRTQSNGEVWSPTAITMEIRKYHRVQDTDLVQWDGKNYRIVAIEVDRAVQCKRLTLEEVNG